MDPLACMLHCLYVTNYSDSPLLQHLLTSWWPAWQLNHFSIHILAPTQALMGLESGIERAAASQPQRQNKLHFKSVRSDKSGRPAYREKPKLYLPNYDSIPDQTGQQHKHEENNDDILRDFREVLIAVVIKVLVIYRTVVAEVLIELVILIVILC